VYATRLCGQAELRHVAVAVLLRAVCAGNVRPVCAAEDLCADNVRAHDVCAENLRPASSEDVRAEDLCTAALLRPLCRLPAGRLCRAAKPARNRGDGAGGEAR
jgi:hypothetical protein